jgi:hypothetical protein
MSLAGIAVLRSVDTGTIIAANLAFRQNATYVGDIGVESARTWLLANGGATLYNNQPAVSGGAGYFATMQTGVDLLGTDPGQADFPWDNTSTVNVTAPAPPAGYAARYVIHRLCDTSGDPGSVNCVRSTGASTAASSTKGAATYSSYAISAPTSAFYRITVRVVGPRNSVSYVQATVY